MPKYLKTFAFAALATAAVTIALPASAQRGKKDANAAQAPAASPAPAESGQSQAAAANGAYKIGIVDVQKVLAEYDKRKRMYDTLQGEVKKLQDGLDAESKAIDAEKADFDKNKNSMSDDKRADMTTKIQQDINKYQLDSKNNQTKIDTMEEKVLKEVFDDIDATIQKIAHDENYHLIMNGKTGQREKPVGNSVLYHAPSIDITSKVQAALASNK